MTITEIAQLAGVSIGTVDRVIHKRGKVSPETAQKVEAVITQSGYRVNPLARHLKLNREYSIGVILPSLNSEAGYWNLVYNGMRKAEEELKPFQGGYTAGRIMKLLVPDAKLLMSFQMHSSAFNSRERSRGFMSYFTRDIHTAIMEIPYTRKHTEEGLYLFWDDFFAIYSDIDGIFVVNDAVYRLAKYFMERGRM